MSMILMWIGAALAIFIGPVWAVADGRNVGNVGVGVCALGVLLVCAGFLAYVAEGGLS